MFFSVPNKSFANKSGIASGNDHISRINTHWSNIADAHREEWSQVADAQRLLIERYAGAIYRYLVAALRNRDAADEVFQEFAMRVLDGGFRHARQDRGRFRDYLKGAIRRLIAGYFRRKSRDPLNGMRDLDNSDAVEPVEPDGAEFERSLNRSCREELLSRTWEELRVQSQQDRNLYYAVLQLRTQNPQFSSPEIASELSARLGLANSLSATAARKTLQRARKRFSELLMVEVAAMCGTQDLDDIETELLNLELHAYCRSAIRKRRDENQQAG